MWWSQLDYSDPVKALLGYRYPSDNERGRAARILRPHAVRSQQARTALRTLVAAYLGRAPRHVVFREGPEGKPETDGLRFNMSHSEGLAVFAVATHCEVGIDVEEIRPVRHLDALSRAVFSESERAGFATIVRGSRDAAFLATWTRKEATLKAIGKGLTCAPRDIETDVLAWASPSGSAFAVHAGGGVRWTLRSVPTPAGYVATVAFEGEAAVLPKGEWRPRR